jgi:hypothetical protein
MKAGELRKMCKLDRRLREDQMRSPEADSKVEPWKVLSRELCGNLGGEKEKNKQ